MWIKIKIIWCITVRITGNFTFDYIKKYVTDIDIEK